MPQIKEIFESDEVIEYLSRRRLTKQYIKAKNNLLSGRKKQAQLKPRQPKKLGYWYFRINKQFRAIGRFDTEGCLIIFAINNHQ